MFGHMSGDALPKIIELLDKEVCAKAEDPKGCKVGVETWWPTIAKILYNDEAAKIVCKGLSEGKCEAFNLK